MNHPEASRRDLSFVIITHNDAGNLARCLKSAALAAAAAGLDYEILLVDNGSRDHTPLVVEAFAGVLGERLVAFPLPRNTGTTHSRNLALRASQGRLIAVLDSDAELLGPDLRPVLELLAEFPEVGIVGPAVLLPGGRIYDSVKRLPTLLDKLWKLPGVLLGRPTVNRDWYPEFPFARLTPVETAISCAWFFRRELFAAIGPLDENIFYAPEDVDYCLRAWLAGRAVVYYPHYRVLHHTQQVSHRRPFSALARSHLAGLLYYFHKHGYFLSRRGLAAEHVAPLARGLAPRLAAWERARGLFPGCSGVLPSQPPGRRE